MTIVTTNHVRNKTEQTDRAGERDWGWRLERIRYERIQLL